MNGHVMRKFAFAIPLLLVVVPAQAKDAGLIYVSNEKSNNIIVLDPKTYKIVNDIKVSRRPRDMHFSADHTKLYIACGDEDVIDVLDVAKGEVTGVKLRDVKTGKIWDQVVDGFFLAIGHIPNTKPFVGQIDLDPDGYILSKGGARTNISGVFHAGDVQDRVYRQAITASGAGCMAAIEAEKFLEAVGH